MHRLVILCSLALCALVGLAGPVLAKKRKKSGGDSADATFAKLYEVEESTDRVKAVETLKKEDDARKYAVVSTKVFPREYAGNVLAMAVEVLSRIKKEPVRLKVLAAARKGKARRRILYMEAAASWKEWDPGHELMLASVKDKDPYVRSLAAWGLGEHKRVDGLAPLLALLADKHWQVQAAALDGIPMIRDKAAVRETVPVIVDYLEEASGRMKHDAAYALKRITGKKHDVDVDAWRRYLAGEEEKPAEGPKKPSGPYATQETKPHYYSMDVKSDNIVILFDVSLSMYDAFDIDKSRLRRETKRRVVTGPDGGKSGGKVTVRESAGYKFDWWRIKTRLDMAREQAKFLVSQLRGHQKFEIIFFSDEVRPWMGRMVKANVANKTRAMLELDEILPEDKTNTWGAMAAAFDLMDNEKKSYKSGPDELYLITDGMPSVGDIVDRDEIFDATMQMWKVHRIRINCVGIGVKLRFMRKLCSKTGGTAVFY